jgi:hypothetical protein
MFCAQMCGCQRSCSVAWCHGSVHVPLASSSRGCCRRALTQRATRACAPSAAADMRLPLHMQHRLVLRGATAAAVPRQLVVAHQLAGVQTVHQSFLREAGNCAWRVDVQRRSSAPAVTWLQVAMEVVTRRGYRHTLWRPARSHLQHTSMGARMTAAAAARQSRISCATAWRICQTG